MGKKSIERPNTPLLKIKRPKFNAQIYMKRCSQTFHCLSLPWILCPSVEDMSGIPEESLGCFSS